MLDQGLIFTSIKIPESAINANRATSVMKSLENIILAKQYESLETHTKNRTDTQQVL